MNVLRKCPSIAMPNLDILFSYKKVDADQLVFQDDIGDTIDDNLLINACFNWNLAR